MNNWYQKNRKKKSSAAEPYRHRLSWQQMLAYLLLTGAASIPPGFLSGYLLGYLADARCFEGSCGLAAWGLAPVAIPVWFGVFLGLGVFLRTRPKLFWAVCGVLFLFDFWWILYIMIHL